MASSYLFTGLAQYGKKVELAQGNLIRLIRVLAIPGMGN